MSGREGLSGLPPQLQQQITQLAQQWGFPIGGQTGGGQNQTPTPPPPPPMNPGRIPPMVQQQLARGFGPDGPFIGPDGKPLYR